MKVSVGIGWILGWFGRGMEGCGLLEDGGVWGMNLEWIGGGWKGLDQWKRRGGRALIFAKEGEENCRDSGVLWMLSLSG